MTSCPSTHPRPSRRQPGVADLDAHLLDLGVERLGGDLGQRCTRAGADVGGGDLMVKLPSDRGRLPARRRRLAGYVEDATPVP